MAHVNHDPPRIATIEALAERTRGQTLLLLVPAPPDTARACAPLIARASARGQPPYVAVLTDGAGNHAEAEALAHQARANAATLGLPANRLLLMGVQTAAAPTIAQPQTAQDRAFLANIAAAIALLSWMKDCHAICAPAATIPGPTAQAARAVARHAARQAGIPRLAWLP